MRTPFSPNRFFLAAGVLACCALTAGASANPSQTILTKSVMHILLCRSTRFSTTSRFSAWPRRYFDGASYASRFEMDADTAVRSIKGIRQVNDRIEVLPASARDGRIQLEIYAAAYGHPLLGGYANRPTAPVHIIVKNGNVTLDGAADTGHDKILFFTAASAVPGVVSVTDHVQVQSQS
jgi:hypothetical protein